MKQCFRVFLVSTLVVLLTACGGSGGSTDSGGNNNGSGGSTGPGGNNNGSGSTTVDTTAPVVTLNGAATIALKIGQLYEEAGATAIDNVDGIVTVYISNNIDNGTVGIYTVTYTATDVAGNESIKTRTVTVGELSATTLKQTGQTVSYYAGDDGDYEKGITPSYTRDDAKEVVTDNVTGLMWQDDNNIVSKQWITSANYNAGNYSDTSGDTATTYCSNLTLGGYSNWRVPTLVELESIIDYSVLNLSIDSVFINTLAGYYSSSTIVAGNPNVNGDEDFVWTVHFTDGVDSLDIVDLYSVVRCVR